MTEASAGAIKAEIDAKGFVLVTVEYRGRTPSGELRHPALKGQASG